MRVLILTLGSRGDVELFVSLAVALAERKHEVILATSPYLQQLSESKGISTIPAGNATAGDFAEFLAALKQDADPLSRTRRFGSQWLIPQLAAIRPMIEQRLPEHDYFINNMKWRVKHASNLMPGASVTYDPPVSVSQLNDYGAPSRDLIDLVAMDRELVDPESEWDARFHFTGFWRHSDSDTESRPLDPSISSFVDSVKKPVAVTLGSMAVFDSAQFLNTLEETMAQCGRKAVVVSAASDFPSPMSNNVMIVPELDYSAFFPRCCAVIHHGGTGTVSAVMKAGVPSILLPQITPQQHYGRLLLAENLAAAVFDIDTLSEDELSEALNRCTYDKRLIQSAESWKERTTAIDGTDNAVRLIEKHWATINQ